MTRRAAKAMVAWQVGSRRRRAAAAIERTADALAVSGATMIVNATGAVDLGLPAGPAGAGIGSAVLVAALAWISRGRRAHQAPRPAVAVAAAQPVWRPLEDATAA